MLHVYNEGDEVQVWPAPGQSPAMEPPSVMETPAGFQLRPARPLPVGGALVRWSSWLQELARSGAILFSDPGKDYQRAENVRHPDEVCSVCKKPARESTGARSEAELQHWKALGFKDGRLKQQPAAEGAK